MNLFQLTVDRHKARAAFLDYRRAVRARHNAEDELLMLGYRALSQGRMVIDLHQTMRQGGVDLNQRPKLAILRADCQTCHLRRPAYGQCTFSDDSYLRKNSARVVSLPNSVFGYSRPDAEGHSIEIRGHAQAPSIPPWARPKAKPENYHLLWEAVWQGVPYDPALLKHLAGPLYVVLATWDLTELERSILALRPVN